MLKQREECEVLLAVHHDAVAVGEQAAGGLHGAAVEGLVTLLQQMQLQQAVG